jgi:hypothetical protein
MSFKVQDSEIGTEVAEVAKVLDEVLPVTWARLIIRNCRELGAVPFVKQLGEVWSRQNGAKSRHASDPTEWPEDLRIQQHPKP